MIGNCILAVIMTVTVMTVIYVYMAWLMPHYHSPV